MGYCGTVVRGIRGNGGEMLTRGQAVCEGVGGIGGLEHV